MLVCSSFLVYSIYEKNAISMCQMINENEKSKENENLGAKKSAKCIKTDGLNI